MDGAVPIHPGPVCRAMLQHARKTLWLSGPLKGPSAVTQTVIKAQTNRGCWTDGRVDSLEIARR